jgi:hypothetical protein
MCAGISTDAEDFITGSSLLLVIVPSSVLPELNASPPSQKQKVAAVGASAKRLSSRFFSLLASAGFSTQQCDG